MDTTGDPEAPKTPKNKKNQNPNQSVKRVMAWSLLLVLTFLIARASKVIFFPEKEVVAVAIAPVKEEGPTVAELQAKLLKAELEAQVEAKAKADAEARVHDRDKTLAEERADALKVRELMVAQQAATDTKIAEAKAKAEAEASRIKEEMEKTLPGEARVVFEPFDPNKHHPQKDAFTTEKKFTVDGELPKFTVKATTDRVKTKEGIINARPVLTPNGQPLKDSGFVPELATSGMKPYKLAVWWESKHAYVNHWFAQ